MRRRGGGRGGGGISDGGGDVHGDEDDGGMESGMESGLESGMDMSDLSGVDSDDDDDDDDVTESDGEWETRTTTTTTERRRRQRHRVAQDESSESDSKQSRGDSNSKQSRRRVARLAESQQRRLAGAAPPSPGSATMSGSPLPIGIAPQQPMDIQKLQLLEQLQAVSRQCVKLQSSLHRNLVSSSTKPFLEEEHFYSFLYEPHTVTSLLVTLALTFYTAFLRPAEDFVSSSKFGLMTVAAVFLVYAVVQIRDSLMIRPHPAFWRLIHGICILYLLALVFLLCQSSTNARRVIRFFYEDMPFEQPASNFKIYAEDCRIHTPGHPEGPYATVMATVFDRFIVAHFLGWWGKAVMLRSWTLSWILCILWELVEYSFQHTLHNFYECWWDHWLIDVMIANFGGMALGMATVRYFEIQNYNWTGTRITARDKFRRILQQFSPYTWTKFEWDIFMSFPRFCNVMLLLVVMEVVELNGFLMKYVLWVPAESSLNSYRLMLWFLLSVPGLREYYQYISDPKQRRLGVNAWMAIGIAVTETAMWIKFADDKLVLNFPSVVKTAWATTLTLLVLWALIKFDIIPCCSRDEKGASGPARSFLLNASFIAAGVPMVWMVVTQDVGWGRVGADAAAAIASG